MTQNNSNRKWFNKLNPQNNSINSKIKHGPVVDKNCCVVFLLQDFYIWPCVPDSANRK